MVDDEYYEDNYDREDDDEMWNAAIDEAFMNAGRNLQKKERRIRNTRAIKKALIPLAALSLAFLWFRSIYTNSMETGRIILANDVRDMKLGVETYSKQIGLNFGTIYESEDKGFSILESTDEQGKASLLYVINNNGGLSFDLAGWLTEMIGSEPNNTIYVDEHNTLGVYPAQIDTFDRIIPSFNEYKGVNFLMYLNSNPTELELMNARNGLIRGLEDLIGFEGNDLGEVMRLNQDE